jgi:transcriptional regulator with XRE-family HTH domain
MTESHRAPERVPAYRKITFGPDVHERGSVLVAFGHNLRAARRKAGLSQETVAMRSFMRRNYMSRLESGECAPDLPALLVLADRLEIPVMMLIGDLEAPVRRAGTDQVRDVISRQPGLSSSAVASALGLPDRYVEEIIFYLRSVGVVVARQRGWQLP